MTPQTVTLHPGDVACLSRGDRLETLLGSCVAILLTDPRCTVGAMCHIVHAGTPPKTAVRTTAYGEAALARMALLLRKRSIDPQQCLAWVYGGGNMFGGLGAVPVPIIDVGVANSEWALGALHRVRIHVMGVAIGGHAYRKLRWTVGHGAPEVETVELARPPMPQGELA